MTQIQETSKIVLVIRHWCSGFIWDPGFEIWNLK